MAGWKVCAVSVTLGLGNPGRVPPLSPAAPGSRPAPPPPLAGAPPSPAHTRPFNSRRSAHGIASSSLARSSLYRCWLRWLPRAAVGKGSVAIFPLTWVWARGPGWFWGPGPCGCRAGSRRRAWGGLTGLGPAWAACAPRVAAVSGGWPAGAGTLPGDSGGGPRGPAAAGPGRPDDARGPRAGLAGQAPPSSGRWCQRSSLFHSPRPELPSVCRVVALGCLPRRGGRRIGSRGEQTRLRSRGALS